MYVQKIFIPWDFGNNPRYKESLKEPQEIKIVGKREGKERVYTFNHNQTTYIYFIVYVLSFLLSGFPGPV